MPTVSSSSFPADFTELSLFKRFEGGTVYTQDKTSKFLVVIDESSIASMLPPEELDDIELIKVIEFATENERTDYLTSRFGSII